MACLVVVVVVVVVVVSPFCSSRRQRSCVSHVVFAWHSAELSMPARANLLMALPAAKGVELQGCRSRRSWSGCTVIDVSINLCAGSINREGDFLGIEAGRQPWSYAPLPTLLLPFQETESSRKSHSIGPILRVALLHLQGQELEHSISILVVESAAILPRHQGLYCSTRCSKPQVTTYSGDCRGMHPSVDELIGDVCTTCICTDRRKGVVTDAGLASMIG